MSFNTALSGLRAANQNLSVTGNNIANASTIGFKQSRAEFGDVYANSILGTGSRTPGNGVVVNQIAQQFDQGNISITNNSFDVAINGSGFFILNDQGSRVYTRAGNFNPDNQGYIVSATGARLQGFGVGANGQILSGALSDLRIQTQDIAPTATTKVDLRINLDSGSDVPTVTPFSTTDPNSYTWSTAATVYDSLGNPHVMTTYYAKSPTAPTPPATGTNWDVYSELDSSGVSHALGTLTFATNGSLAAPTPASFADTWAGSGGAAPINFSLNLAGSTQFGSASSASALYQDGYAPGRLASVDIDDSGVVFARYTNGQALTLGQVALANFSNPQGLTPVGNTNWAESFASGQPVVGSPQTGSRGSLQSGALEDSNVDLSSELVNLILAQRDYQANAKTIETSNATTQTIINLR